MDSYAAFIISQILVVIGYGFNCLSFYTKSRGKLLFISSGMSVFIGLSLVCLNAWSGVVCQALAIVRNVVFYFTQKNDSATYKAMDFVWLAVFILAAIGGGILTYNQWFSVLPIISASIYTFAIWQKHAHHFKYYVFYSSVTMIIYYVFIWSPVAVVLECIAFVAIVISIIKQLCEIRKTKTEAVATTTKNDIVKNEEQDDKN